MNNTINLFLDRHNVAVQMAKQGWNMDDLAAVSGLSRQALWRAMRGHAMQPKNVYKIAAAFGCDVEQIINKEETK